MFISIIITNYNGLNYLENCFDSILNQNLSNFEIIFADDCSTDKSVDFIKKKYPKVKISSLKKNSGLSVNSNQARKLCKGDLLFFMNNDTYFKKNFFNDVLSHFKEEIDAICVKQYEYDPISQNDTSNSFLDYDDLGSGVDCFGYVCLAKLSKFIFYSDAHIMIRKDFFDKIGGFDNNFLLYGEDVDLFFRFHIAGGKLFSTKKIYFNHDTSCTIGYDAIFQSSSKRRELVERQSLNMMLTYYSPIITFFLLIIRVPLNFFEMLFLIFFNNPKSIFKIYFGAYIWNIKKIPAILKKRSFVKKIRKISDFQLLKMTYIGYRKLGVFLERKKIPRIN